MNRYPNASAGLRLMFIAQLLMIAGALLLWVPLVGSLLAIGGIAAEIVGIYKAGADDENYRGALIFAAATLVISLILGFLQPGFFASLLSAASDVLNLLKVFAVCSTTVSLLHLMGEETLSQRGGTVIKIYGVCTAVSIICRVLSIIPVINIAAALVSGIAGLALVVGYVMYLLFLNGSSKAL